ncbi:hypothetical protein [Actinokineospora sp. NBRC 105648]|uniref:sunset domain-containing protein n=1 Tax=Actinokineospora sp. NBRC 105648 TaxID=3032206 RepID=UPI0024A45D0A|nr:hypothetical protein Acsp05_36570 [Actinokineospora sp. NBRC 105648]
MPFFGQVWVWSLAGFLVGAVLCWALIANPARKRVTELEGRLAGARKREATPAADPEPTTRERGPSSLVPGFGTHDDLRPVGEPAADRDGADDIRRGLLTLPDDDEDGLRALPAPAADSHTDSGFEPVDLSRSEATQYIPATDRSELEPDRPEWVGDRDDAELVDDLDGTEVDDLDEAAGDEADETDETEPAALAEGDEDAADEAADYEPEHESDHHYGDDTGTIFTQHTTPIPGELIRRIDAEGKAEAEDHALVDDLDDELDGELDEVPAADGYANSGVLGGHYDDDTADEAPAIAAVDATAFVEPVRAQQPDATETQYVEPVRAEDEQPYAPEPSLADRYRRDDPERPGDTGGYAESETAPALTRRYADPVVARFTEPKVEPTHRYAEDTPSRANRYADPATAYGESDSAYAQHLSDSAAQTSRYADPVDAAESTGEPEAEATRYVDPGARRYTQPVADPVEDTDEAESSTGYADPDRYAQPDEEQADQPAAHEAGYADPGSRQSGPAARYARSEADPVESESAAPGYAESGGRESGLTSRYARSDVDETAPGAQHADPGGPQSGRVGRYARSEADAVDTESTTHGAGYADPGGRQSGRAGRYGQSEPDAVESESATHAGYAGPGSRQSGLAARYAQSEADAVESESATRQPGYTDSGSRQSGLAARYARSEADSADHAESSRYAEPEAQSAAAQHVDSGTRQSDLSGRYAQPDTDPAESGRYADPRPATGRPGNRHPVGRYAQADTESADAAESTGRYADPESRTAGRYAGSGYTDPSSEPRYGESEEEPAAEVEPSGPAHAATEVAEPAHAHAGAVEQTGFQQPISPTAAYGQAQPGRTSNVLPKRIPSKPQNRFPFGVQTSPTAAPAPTPSVPATAPQPAPAASATAAAPVTSSAPRTPDRERSLFEPILPADEAAAEAKAVPPPPHRLRGARTFQQSSSGVDPFVPPGPFGPGSAMPLPGGRSPSSEYTIKASVTALRYCSPDSPKFDRTVAEVWFRSVADAERVGFRPLA